MKILIIIPAYNEEKNIRSAIADIQRSDLLCDILIVNDGSTDRTSHVARSIPHVVVVDLPFNLGIGGAVQTGFKYAERNGYDIAVQFDGDAQHKASEISKLLDSLVCHEADVVIGSRFLEKGPSFRSTFMRRKGIFIFKIINYLLIRQVITDNTSGFRAYNREAVVFLAHNYPADYPEPESVVLLGRHGFRIKEVPVFMQQRNFGRSSIRGWRIIYYMVKVLLSICMTSLRGKTCT